MESKINKTIKRKLPQDLTLTDQQLEKRLRDGQNENKVKSEAKAHRAFQSLLSPEWSHRSETIGILKSLKLDNWLAKFWLCVCKEEDETDSESESQDQDPHRKSQMYSANTLQSFRYGLNRILRTKGPSVQKLLTKETSFLKSDEAFKVVIKELKSEGKGQIHSHPEINEQGTVY